MTGSTGGGYSYGGGYGGGGGYSYGYGGGELSDEEKELIEAQTEALRRQTQINNEMYALHKTLLPMHFKQLGYDLEYDAQGNITGYKPDETGLARQELDKGYLDRQLMALRGELPISPALEESLNRSEQQLRDRMAQQLGTGWETSSAGIEALQSFETARLGLEEDVRQGILSGGEALSIGRGADIAGRSASAGATALGAPGTVAQLFGQVAQGYGQAVQPYTQSRIAANQLASNFNIAQMQSQAQMAGYQSQQGGMGALLPLLLAGGLSGGTFGIPSDERLKTDVESTGVTLGDVMNLGQGEGGNPGLANVDVPTWRYKTDPAGTKRMGPMAQDVEDVAPDAVNTDASGIKYLDGNRLAAELWAMQNKSRRVGPTLNDVFRRNG